MKNLKILAVATLILMNTAANAESENDFEITQITTYGKGCPKGSVGKLVASDGQSFTLIYDDFTLEMLEKSWSRANVLMGPQRQKIDCKMNISLKIPKNQRVTIASIDYRGYADLDEGVSMIIESRHQFGNSGLTLWSAESLVGEQPGSFMRTASPLNPSKMEFSSCGRGSDNDDQIVLATSFILQRSTCTMGGGFISMDSLDGLATSEEKTVISGKKVMAQRFRINHQNCN